MGTRQVLLWSVVVCVITACTPSPQARSASTPTPKPATPVPTATSTATPTPTPTGAAAAEQVSICQDLSGSLEIQILVGPSDAVGLEPEAVGTLPWQVTGDVPPYPLAGNSWVSYQDTLVKEWGTYDVRMDMEVTVEGTCDDAGDGSLTMTVTMEGEQLVTVTSEGFSGEYPWAGTQSRTVSFPITEGATASGEGWAFVLHLN